MTKFIFKSNASDLQKISQSIETIQKNVLYITFRVDKILREVTSERINKSLQNTVDQYFDETSPQTDSENTDGSN